MTSPIVAPLPSRARPLTWPEVQAVLRYGSRVEVGALGHSIPGLTAAKKWELWGRVIRRGDCWCWCGPVNAAGYGTASIAGKTWLVPRLFYAWLKAPLPRRAAGGPFVLHKCDLPPCCNPACLFQGTTADNAADMMAKGRGRFFGQPTPSVRRLMLAGAELPEFFDWLEGRP